MPHSTLTYRRAQRADLPKIVAMLADDDLGQQREDSSMPPNPRYVAAFEAISRDPNQYLAVVESAGNVVGCMQLTFIPGLSRLGMLRGQIESVRICSSMRGAGMGRAMFEWAIDYCRAQGCEIVQLTTDKQRPDARRFYEALGFTATHDGMKLPLRLN